MLHTAGQDTQDAQRVFSCGHDGRRRSSEDSRVLENRPVSNVKWSTGCINANRRWESFLVNRKTGESISYFIIYFLFQRQGLMRCYFGSGWFHSPDGCSLSVTLERSSHFFSVTPSFGHMEYGTTSLGWCGQLKWTSHLSPKWKEIRGKGDIAEGGVNS